MRERDTRVCERPHAGGDPRYDLEPNARLCERECLLGAAPEHERISTFEPDHHVMAVRQLHQHAVDPLLGEPP